MGRLGLRLSLPKRVAVLSAVVIAYGAIAVATAAGTLYTSIFTAIPGLVALSYAVRRGWHRPTADVPEVRIDALGVLGLMIWTLLFTVLAVWVLVTFFSHPRTDYPTLSYLMNIVFENYGLRVVGFVAWLGLGWYLVRR